MVKAAFAIWNGRIAPVFDVARLVHVVETEAGQIVGRRQVNVAGEIPNLKASRLAELEIGTLVCGAISRPLLAMITAYGITVIPFVAGNLQEVVQAWLCGKLAGSSAFAMPGCGSPGGGRFKKNYRKNQGEVNMKGNRQGKKSAGQGPGFGGQGGARQGTGRRGRSSGAGSGSSVSQGACVCPRCGHHEPHERGTPCAQKKCTQCGAVMSRK